MCSTWTAGGCLSPSRSIDDSARSIEGALARRLISGYLGAMPMNMKSTFILLAVALAASTAFARSQYQQEIPNGTTFRCLTCHTGAGGGEGWNLFGQDILREGGANPDANPTNQNDGYDIAFTPGDHYPAICEDDSDGDGATNGEELNDADCDGIEDAEGALSNPGNPESTPEAPGDPEDPIDGGDLGAGGCAAAPAAPVALLALLALGRRRRA
jgi:uncharacterized protein (TIGR03382 family)